MNTNKTMRSELNAERNVNDEVCNDCASCKFCSAP